MVVQVAKQIRCGHVITVVLQEKIISQMQGKQPEIKDRRKKTASNTIFRHSDIVIILSKEKCTILWRNVLCIVEEGVNTVEPKETQKCVLWIQITSFLYP